MLDIKKLRLIIFDLDGTLVRTKSGETFRKTAADWEWLPGRREVARRLTEHGITTALATNQAGVAFGYLDEVEMHRELWRTQDEMNAAVLRVCFAHPNAPDPTDREDAGRRKPGGAMLREIMNEVQIAAPRTLMVGDRPEDEGAAADARVLFMWADDFFARFSTPAQVDAAFSN